MVDKNRADDLNTSGSRRLKYGSNLFLLMIIAIVIVAMLAYLTTYYAHRHRPFDWSTGGLFTLSSQTQKLLQTMDEKKQPYEVINNFSADSTADLVQVQQVRDLVDQYLRQTSYIKAVEPKSRDELETKIRQRYTGETQPYKDAVAGFEPLAVELDKFFQTQADGFSALSQAKELSPDDAREIQSVANIFQKQFPALIEKTRKNIRNTLDSTTPEWSKAKSQIIEILSGIDDQFKRIVSAGDDTDPFSKVMQGYLVKAAPDYTAILKHVDAYKDRLDKLPSLKVDDILESIAPNTLIIIGPDNVKTITFDEMFHPDTAGSPDPDHPKYAFQGEQVISTALMSMVQPNKPKVVFITGSPAQLLSGPFSEIADRLNKANFDTSEWSPPGMPQPDQPPPPATPPASGKDSGGKPVVWVVLPPEPPTMQQMQMGMPPPDPKPLIEAVKKHMDAGGNVMFLAEGDTAMSMMGGGGYPFADLVKPYGIDVKSKYYVLHSVRVSESGYGGIPQIDFDTFPDHPITAPLQSLTTLFVGSPGQMGVVGAPTIVDIAKPVPAGADPAIIVQTPASADYFATTNIMKQTPEFDPKQDLKSPVPMAVASALKNGQRVVVIGNKLFLVNQLLQEQGLDMQSGRVFSRFPGNAELMINCVSWLSGYENMIAVSPQANVAQRIASMGEVPAMLLRIGSLLVPPMLAIGIGTIIFFVRRRG